MANLASNPWSFSSSDILSATPAASPTGFVLSANGSVALTTTLAHGFSTGDWLTVIDATASAYNGAYRVTAVPTATTATLSPKNGIAAGTAASGGGTVAKCLYPDNIRAEDLSWQNAQAAGHILDLRDRNGNIIWQATASGAGVINRGKIFWIHGLTPITIQSGVVLATVN